MRNLKRVLALALALIMTLGLMITASAASYADADQIDANYGEAIEVLTNMGVFRGQANGGESTEFAPKDILTRAEAATLVYRLLTADVTDAKKSNYDYTSFDDVKEGEWWTGYITYAANGKYVVGYGNGKFGPNDQVTGIEVLTIMLRALGYGQNGEFVGGGWKDHVLTTANENGMLKGVATDDLDKGASRELVAQLLFNAITVPSMVNYAPLTGYSKTAQTLGEKNFGLVEIDGVVTANEWADLYDTVPLDENETEIDGKVYNYSSTLDDIGESRRGWATGKTVLFLTDSGKNVVFETGDATVLYDGKKDNFKKVTGLTDSAEHFLNFGTDGSYKTSDYKIKYVLVFDTAASDEVKEAWSVLNAKGKDLGDWSKDNKTYTREIEPESEITEKDRTNIRTIFYNADLTTADGQKFDIVDGEVYVGTQSKTDISDEISYKQFLAKYVDTAESAMTITDTENGEWLKVIDNNNDGKAEYVLKTEYILDEITGYSKRTKAYSFNSKLDTNENIPCYVDGYEPEVGDVVIYALIDGNAYVELAATEVATIKTVSYKNETITTADGNTYGQSGIFNETGYAEVITDVADKTSYNLYFDKFGYVRAYNEVEGSTVYGLLTEAYITNEFNSKYVKNEVGVVELTAGDEKTTEYAVTNYTAKGGNVFFQDEDTVENPKTGKTYINWLTRADEKLGTSYETAARFDWDPTKTVRTSDTNVAKYVLTDDGVKIESASKQATNKSGALLYYYEYTENGKTITTKITAAEAKKLNADVKDLKPVMAVDYVQLNIANITKGARSYATSEDNNVYVNAVHDTQYYLVQGSKITYFTDYKNLPAIDAGYISAIYAVAQNTTADEDTEDYWVADVIVIELDKWDIDYDSISLAFYNDIKNVDDVKWLDTLNNKSESTEIRVVPTKEGWKGQWDEFGFYALYETEVGENITAKSIDQIGRDEDGNVVYEYNKNDIYAGTIDRIAEIKERGDFIEVNTALTGKKITDVTVFYSEEVPVYAIGSGSNGKTAAKQLDWDEDVKTGDRIIWVMNGKNTAFVVDVSYNERNWGTEDWLYDSSVDVDSEWEFIMAEQNPAPAVKGTAAEVVVTLGDDLAVATLNSGNKTDTDVIAFAADDPAGELEFTAVSGIGTAKNTSVIELENGWNDDVDAYVYRAVITSEDDEEQLEVKYTVTVTAADDDTTLVVKKGIDGIQIDGTTIAILGNEKVTVGDLMNAVEATGLNAEVTWSFKSAAATHDEDSVNKGASTDDYRVIEATVKAENGNTATYTLGVIEYDYTEGDVITNNTADEDWNIKSIAGDSSDDTLVVTVERTGTGVGAKDRTWTVKLDGEELGTVTTDAAIAQNGTVTLTVPAAYADGTITVEMTY